ncbi:MAG: carboxylating nicotinate-nucleotide diphosphorylase [Methanoregulaceae archaeon]|nr:carboxylating nicotinate-nucleotide diphosphorylase [Methanoregulaceae archaeon]
MTTGKRYLLSLLYEDSPYGDFTTEAIIDKGECEGRIIANESGILAGLEEARFLFSSHGVAMDTSFDDGDEIFQRSKLCSLSGDAHGMLLVERTALNIIGRMSGIATRTHEFVEVVRKVSPTCRIAATRKTSPGSRVLDKRAVEIGGGETHRYGLSDGVLIKDNHLVLVSLEEAIRRAKGCSVYRKVEVEVGSPDEAMRAARLGADIIMCDNMDPIHVSETTGWLSAAGLREKVIIEVSGGVNIQNIKDFASLDVDVISIGMLTHTVKNFDCSLEICSLGKK